MGHLESLIFPSGPYLHVSLKLKRREEEVMVAIAETRAGLIIKFKKRLPEKAWDAGRFATGFPDEDLEPQGG